MAYTDIDICSGALIMIGAEPITSLTEDTTEGKVCANLYRRTMEDLLTSHRWRFAVGQVAMSRLEDEPDGKWDAAYQLPDDCLTPITVMIGGTVIAFDRFEDNIYCNASTSDTVVLQGIFWVDEQFWPPYFIRLAEFKLASLIAEALGSKTELANLFEDRAEKQFARGKNIDSQGRTAVRFDTSRIVRRRFRHGLYSGRDY